MFFISDRTRYDYRYAEASPEVQTRGYHTSRCSTNRDSHLRVLFESDPDQQVTDGVHPVRRLKKNHQHDY